VACDPLFLPRGIASALAWWMPTTAEQLMLHKNTVKYRICKAQESLGWPVGDNHHEVELAVQASHWLGSFMLLLDLAHASDLVGVTGGSSIAGRRRPRPTPTWRDDAGPGALGTSSNRG